MRKTDVSDDEPPRRLLELSKEIDGWHGRFENGLPGSSATSQLAEDSRLADPFQLSHAASRALGHAADNLHASAV